jgi:alcohol dehydrogenase
MNPNHVVPFAPAVGQLLWMLANVFKDARLTEADMDALSGRDLSMAAPKAIVELSQRAGFRTTRGEVEGFAQRYMAGTFTAAKSPQLKMKLENMPVPLTGQMVDDCRRSALEATRTGDLGLIKNVA